MTEIIGGLMMVVGGGMLSGASIALMASLPFTPLPDPDPDLDALLARLD